MSAITGGLLLDRAVPRWAPLIDRDRLDMGDPEWCVLAQLCPARIVPAGFGHLRWLIMARHLSGLPDHQRERWSHKHGFLAAGSGYPVASLTRDWDTQVTIRLEAVA